MNNYTVYKHTSPSNKVYIGITKHKVKRRWKYGHGYVHNRYFHNAIKKYGWSNIRHEIIESNLSLEEASLKEKELIAFYTKQGLSYNIAEGGTNGNTMNRTESEKQHLSDFFKDYYKTHEHPLKGKSHSEETKKKLKKISTKRWRDNYQRMYEAVISTVKVGVFNILTGKYNEFPSEKEAATALGIKETTFRRHVDNGGIISNYILIPIDSISFEEALLKAYNREMANIHCGGQEIEIVQLDLEGNYMNTFSSAKQASLETSCNVCGIGKACRGEVKQSGGYFWMFNSKYLHYKETGEIEVVLRNMQDKLRCRKEICTIPIMQMSLEGTPIHVFKSGKEITRRLGFDSSVISKCCRGKLAKAYNFMWKYITKEEYNMQEYLRKH